MYDCLSFFRSVSFMIQFKNIKLVSQRDEFHMLKKKWWCITYFYQLYNWRIWFMRDVLKKKKNKHSTSFKFQKKKIHTLVLMHKVEVLYVWNFQCWKTTLKKLNKFVILHYLGMSFYKVGSDYDKVFSFWNANSDDTL